MVITAVRTATPFVFRENQPVASVHFDTETSRTWRLGTDGTVLTGSISFPDQARFLAWLTAPGMDRYWIAPDPDLAMDVGL